MRFLSVFLQNRGEKSLSEYINRRFGRSIVSYLLLSILILLSFPFLLIIRIISPFYLIRFGGLWNQHIGHYAMCTEIYLSKKDLEKANSPKKRTIDLFYLRSNASSNNYLTLMWKRSLKIMPTLPLKALAIANKLIPGGSSHDLGLPAFDRDIDSSLENTLVHLKFTEEEIKFGDQQIQKIGILNSSPFVCLLVRDDAYYNSTFSFTNYRNADINNYLLAAESLAELGYYVIRMGAKVNVEMKSNNKKVIDYAFNGMRNEFMDIYLASKCAFCITTGSGWDNLPNIFRRPIVYTNLLPIADFLSSSERFINITKPLISIIDGHELSLKEIINGGLLCTRELDIYKLKGVKFIENTPEQIRDVVFEMHYRLNNIFIETEQDNRLQKRFWKIIMEYNPKDKSGEPMHYLPKGRVGNSFLKSKPFWLN